MVMPTTTRAALRLAASFSVHTNALRPAAALSTAASAPEHNNEPDFKDSFQTLGVARRFGLEHSDLKKKYHMLMNEYHPDKHQDKSFDERNLIDQKAASITHAFQTLSHPNLRAKHLLTLLGNPVR